MATFFCIQVRSITRPLWYEPRHDHEWAGKAISATTVSALREAIAQVADQRTLSFRIHARIVTSRGEPVERWKIRPGKAWRAWRKF